MVTVPWPSTTTHCSERSRCRCKLSLFPGATVILLTLYLGWSSRISNEPTDVLPYICWRPFSCSRKPSYGERKDAATWRRGVSGGGGKARGNKAYQGVGGHDN